MGSVPAGAGPIGRSGVAPSQAVGGGGSGAAPPAAAVLMVTLVCCVCLYSCERAADVERSRTDAGTVVHAEPVIRAWNAGDLTMIDTTRGRFLVTGVHSVETGRPATVITTAGAGRRLAVGGYRWRLLD